jgi:outer membrane receptor protein involved in Fe transport
MRPPRVLLPFALLAIAPFSPCGAPLRAEEPGAAIDRGLSDFSSATVVTGAELRERGARDLADALSLVAGVVADPGGIDGPASTSLDLGGFGEGRHWLLVVDDVPWGDPFEADSASIDLAGVDRIEIMKGPELLRWGGRGLAGVVHVHHAKPGGGGSRSRIAAGSDGALAGGFEAPLGLEPYAESLQASAEKRGFQDDRAGFKRGHLLWSASGEKGGGTMRVDVDATFVRQTPTSALPRGIDGGIDPSTPIDSNRNTRDARFDENRYRLVLGWDRPLGSALWKTILSVTRSERDSLEGELFLLADEDPNALGRSADRKRTFGWAESRIERSWGSLKVEGGVDLGLSRLEGRGTEFEYYVPLDGSELPASGDFPVELIAEDVLRRIEWGAVLTAVWSPAPHIRVGVGGRAGRAQESRDLEREDAFASVESLHLEESRGVRSASITILAPFVDRSGEGITPFAAWHRGRGLVGHRERESLDSPIPEPSEVDSVEAGVRWNLGGGRFEGGLSLFRRRLEDDPADVELGGTGTKRLVDGIEAELRVGLGAGLRASVSASRHDVRIDSPTEGELHAGLVPERGGALGLLWSGGPGIGLHAEGRWLGRRWLEDGGGERLPALFIYSAGLSLRIDETWRVRGDGWNLTDERPPVARGAGSLPAWHLLPGRCWAVSLAGQF